MPYVYRHIRLDNDTVFYIGIGNDNRYNRANEKKNRGSHWKNIVKKTDYEGEILFEHEDYNFIKEKEVVKEVPIEIVKPDLNVVKENEQLKIRNRKLQDSFEFNQHLSRISNLSRQTNLKF